MTLASLATYCLPEAVSIKTVPKVKNKTIYLLNKPRAVVLTVFSPKIVAYPFKGIQGRMT